MGNAKEAAGRYAADQVADGMLVGLGTGSTVHFVLARLKERIRMERLSIHGVPSSEETAKKALSFGIHLTTLEETEQLDITIDGADEVDGDFNLIKGGGGALLREKVLASISKKLIIVVSEDKLVDRLGASFPLPVEVVPFAAPTVSRALKHLGAEPELRRGENGKPVVTDNGNQIVDCRFPEGILDPQELELQLALIPGVVDSGLFVQMAQQVVIGYANGRVEVRKRPR